VGVFGGFFLEWGFGGLRRYPTVHPEGAKPARNPKTQCLKKLTFENIFFVGLTSDDAKSFGKNF